MQDHAESSRDDSTQKHPFVNRKGSPMRRSPPTISCLLIVLAALFFQVRSAADNAQPGELPSKGQAANGHRIAAAYGINALLIMENGFIDNTALYGFSGFKALLEQKGITVTQVFPADMTKLDLASYHVVVFSPRWWGDTIREPSDAEARHVLDHVAKGRSLLLLGEHGLYNSNDRLRVFANKLGATFGLKFTEGILCDPNSNVWVDLDPDKGVDSPVVLQENMTAHPITSGVQSFSLAWGCPLTVSGTAQGLAATSSVSWNDTDAVWDQNTGHFNCLLNPATEPQKAHTILGIATTGVGTRVVAIGDTTLMNNDYLGHLSNSLLISNCIDWLCGNLENSPVPRIEADGKTGIITITPHDPVSITVSLDAGNAAGLNSDWWIAALTPFDWFSFVVPAGWQSGIHLCVQYPLVHLASPFEVLKSNLPAGDYTFFFAVDDNADGLPNATWFDFVQVQVR